MNQVHFHLISSSKDKKLLKRIEPFVLTNIPKNYENLFN